MSMKRLAAIAILLIIFLPSAFAWNWFTGLATGQKISVSLFEGEREIGTANPDSHGQARAIAPGQTLRILLEGQDQKTSISIRQGSEEMIELQGDIIDGAGIVLFQIPMDWSGNYHVDVNGELDSAEEEFKVRGLGCYAVTEECDGVDNDCDGVIDDVQPRSCGTSDIGACSKGTSVCEDGHWTQCQGLVEPEQEQCDGIDNDCDGFVDEDMTRACGITEGACREGVESCIDGEWGECAGEMLASEEVCDAVDNDCDGLIDETCFCAVGDIRQCGTNTGACVAGIQTCSGEKWGECLGEVAPSTEKCDGVDNDCDGLVDEDLTQECEGNSLGQCSPGIKLCEAGAWSACQGAEIPSDEVCDGLDNDCDGQIDESRSRSCGACGSGSQSCEEGRWTQCTAQDKVLPEICDGMDNDCDGKIDEGLSRPCGCDCADARVLVVKDLGHNDEDTADFDFTIGLLERQQVDYDVMDEPASGLSPSDISGYDLLWFINPGWPMDTRKTLETLQQWYDDGNALVLQGDDMTWGTGELGKADIEPLTGLRNINNGLDTDYWVNFADKSHPLLTYLRGKTFRYTNDDIDTSVISSDDVAEIAHGIAVNSNAHNGPAITVRDGTQRGKGILMVTLLTMSEIEPQWQAETLVGSTVAWLLNEAGKCVCGIDVGSCRIGVQTCSEGDWGECSGVPPIHETCNGIDDDCDGRIDNGVECECRDGETEDCGSDLGVCEAGTRTCSSGQWGECVGATTSQSEICNGLDDDCDGEIDEGVVLACGVSNEGPCRLGIQTCVDGQLTECEGAINPSEETCDSQDNDCDGVVDEGACECRPGETRNCDAGEGACSVGLEFCDEGRWTDCVAVNNPTEERCNNIDDDCDGLADEDVQRPCGSDAGICSAGTQKCVAGQWVACENASWPQQEMCNGLDDDCDGMVDDSITCECNDGETQSCGNSVGVCSPGTQQCVGGAWGACAGGTESAPEICDGLDNDCDGAVDEGLSRLCGESDIGICSLGRQSCDEGSWSACEGEILSMEEQCDDVDNDCDGKVDEGCEVGGPIIIATKPKPAKVGGGITCESGDGCSEDCASTDPDCLALLYINIVDSPSHVDVDDKSFGVVAVVTNNGSMILPNVIAKIADTPGWAGDRVSLGSMDPGESKTVTFAMENNLCPTDKTPLTPLPETVNLVARAFSGDIADEDQVNREVVVPELGLLTNFDDRKIRTCLIVGNEGPARNKLEAEFEIYDQTDDRIVDLVSPLPVGEKTSVVKVLDYPLRDLAQAKLWRARASLFENGTLFTKGYHVASARTQVDLTGVAIPRQMTLWDFLDSLWEVF